ncbi:MAG: anaerobic glycerol-3-phosphate dehydrogenase subunit A [Desulfatiglandaceae bacterium]
MHTQVLIIGGGATGTGLARDLALRGVHCTLVEKSHLNAGASGRNHGLLHSGARYVGTDPIAAKQCHEENLLLKKIIPRVIEDTNGLFVAIEGDDEQYIADFPNLCKKCGIPVQAVDVDEARELEPSLSAKLIAAYRVDDGAIDPFALCRENIAQAESFGSSLLLHTEVIGFKKQGNQITETLLRDRVTGTESAIEADTVVNAAGAWVGHIAAMAGIAIHMLYSKGTLLVTGHRFTRHVINRLRPPHDGDILVPGGSVSILGTTSIRVDSPDVTLPSFPEIDLLVNEGAAMLPVLKNTRFVRAYAGVRPLLDFENGFDDRSVSRGFSLLDHSNDGLENFLSIPGGKLTTYRFMAEKTADVVCDRLGVKKPSVTAVEPVPSTGMGRWSEPGAAARVWIEQKDPDDPVLCECEIVPQSLIRGVISSITKKNMKPSLLAIGEVTRVGKGVCQGTFCGARITAAMHSNGDLCGDDGLGDLKDFLRERWRGERPALWDGQLIQAELKEAFYCGLAGLELRDE